LLELYRHDELKEEHIPAMSYVSMTSPGVTRGPHEHKEQTDLFCFAGPSMFRLYLWENRHDETAFGQRWTVDCGDNNRMAIIVPPGIVHAYKNIGSIDGIVFNAPNKLYAGAGRSEEIDEIRYEDSAKSGFVVD